MAAMQMKVKKEEKTIYKGRRGNSRKGQEVEKKQTRLDT